MATIKEAQAFIDKIGPIIAKKAAEKGYKYPSAIIAQACLESAYGTSALSAKYNNYFGMKCGSTSKGASVSMKTLEEYSPGTKTQISGKFRVFLDMESGVDGYFSFINTPRYSKLKSATSNEDYLCKIKDAGYATSYTYVKNCLNLIDRWNLSAFDNVRINEQKEEALETLLPLADIVNEVIAGKWGNGNSRKSKLTKAGYDYRTVQDAVNLKLKGGK